MKNLHPASLVLTDGTTYHGWSFGASVSVTGEVVFSTGMVGYPEALTDPSYEGQIVTMTYPLIGNYGVPRDGLESDRVHVRGLVVQEYIDTYSHAAASHSLDSWLRLEHIPAIMGIDTRAVTKKLRDHGTMLGGIMMNHVKLPRTMDNPNDKNLVDSVSIGEPKIYNKGGKYKIMAVDCGMKENIVREFCARGVELIRVPWDYNYLHDEWDGLFLSNGPGDPVRADVTIQHVRQTLRLQKPIFGICLGSQILGLAAGAKTYKLKFGHRSQNQPCKEEGTRHCVLTTQNHGFAVDEKTLPRDWRVWFRNANDNSVEGIRHTKKPFWAVQFHPEANPGPQDTNYLFDEFIALLKK